MRSSRSRGRVAFGCHAQNFSGSRYCAAEKLHVDKPASLDFISPLRASVLRALNYQAPLTSQLAIPPLHTIPNPGSPKDFAKGEQLCLGQENAIGRRILRFDPTHGPFF